jgi:hypothetical protein
MALLRNLRNIEQTGDEMLIDLACKALGVEKAIRNSKVLPFRFETAMGEIRNRKLIMALSHAEEIALANVPHLDGRTAVVVDVSGSMWTPVGKSRTMTCNVLAALFAAALYKSNDCDVMTFDTRARYVSLNPTDSLSTISDKIARSGGGGTDFRAIFETLSEAYDRIIILSDMQAWVGYHAPQKELKAYRRKYGSDPHVYSFDLAGYGTMQFPEQKVYALAGFSEKVFDVMALLEQDRNAMVNAIEAVEL